MKTQAGNGYKKKDYKHELTEDEFNRFTEYRVARKQISSETGLSAFLIFTDAEIAAFSKGNVKNIEDMAKIETVSVQKVQNYGSRILDIIESNRSKSEETQQSDAPNL